MQRSQSQAPLRGDGIDIQQGEFPLEANEKMVFPLSSVQPWTRDPEGLGEIPETAQNKTLGNLILAKCWAKDWIRDLQSH